MNKEKTNNVTVADMLIVKSLWLEVFIFLQQNHLGKIVKLRILGSYHRDAQVWDDDLEMFFFFQWSPRMIP
jgi:hypothetical protein